MSLYLRRGRGSNCRLLDIDLEIKRGQTSDVLALDLLAARWRVEVISERLHIAAALRRVFTYIRVVAWLARRSSRRATKERPINRAKPDLSGAVE